MEKLASRHAITELMSWISLMENIIEEDQDKILGAVGSEVVQNFLQKYKVRQTLPEVLNGLQLPSLFLSCFIYHVSAFLMSDLCLTGFPHRSDLQAADCGLCKPVSAADQQP